MDNFKREFAYIFVYEVRFKGVRLSSFVYEQYVGLCK